MDKFINLSTKDRNSLFRETANKMNTTIAVVEKDFWVVYALDKCSIYYLLVFKLILVLY